MSEKNEWINNFASICTGKENGNLYISVRKDITLKAGDNVRMVKMTDEIDRKVDAGLITADEAEAQKEKFGFIKYTLHKPPRK